MTQPCFYCHDDKVSVCVCLSCRSRLEGAERELKDLKQQIELRRQAYFKKLNERRREIKRNLK
jgi:hypothetical protein